MRCASAPARPTATRYRALSFQVESDSALKSLIPGMILSEKSATFRDHALTTDNLMIGYIRQSKPARYDAFACFLGKVSRYGRGPVLACMCARMLRRATGRKTTAS